MDLYGYPCIDLLWILDPGELPKRPFHWLLIRLSSIITKLRSPSLSYVKLLWDYCTSSRGLFFTVKRVAEMMNATVKQSSVLGNAIPVLGVKPKREWYVFWVFFQIGLCSAILFKRSRRELSIDVAQHRLR